MKILRKPEWIRKELFFDNSENSTKEIIKKFQLNTVCNEARCPNRGECFTKKTATFLLMGNICTRNCRFCNISPVNNPLPLDIDEPRRIALATKEMNLKYVVLTSVTRDDLNDQGVSVFVETVREIKKLNNNILIELLVPDLFGKYDLIEKILKEDIVVFNHNMETVKELYNEVRPMAEYKKSLNVLKTAKLINENKIVKTGIMVGLGETEEQVLSLMEDFHAVKGDILTIGQYLQPGKNFYPVKEYVLPEQFEKYKLIGEKMGIKQIIASPFVRSSYMAENYFLQ